MIKKLLGSWAWEIAGVACVLLLVLLLLASCEAQRKADEAEALARAGTKSAVEAIQKLEDLKGRSEASDAQVQEAIQDVRKAAPEDRDAVFRARLSELQHGS